MKKIIILLLFLGASVSFGMLLPKFDITAYGISGTQSNAAGEFEGILPLYSGNKIDIIYTNIRGLAYIQDALEGNIALGWRHRLSKNGIYGLHGGVDIKRTKLKNYFQQTAFGLEYWYKNMFVGLNGYIPFQNVKKSYSTYVLAQNNNSYRTLHVTDFVENILSGFDLWLGYEMTPKIQTYIRGFYFGSSGFDAYIGGALRGEYKFSGKNGQAIKGWLSHIVLFVEGRYDTYNKIVGSGGFRISISDPKQIQKNHFMDIIRRDTDVITVNQSISPTIKVLAPDGTDIHIYDVYNDDDLKMAKNHQDANVIALHGKFDGTNTGNVTDLNRNVTLTGKDYSYIGSDGKKHTLNVSSGAQITFSKQHAFFAITNNKHDIILRDITIYNAGSIFLSKDNSLSNKSQKFEVLPGLNVSYINDVFLGDFQTTFIHSNSDNNIVIKDSVVKTSEPINFIVRESNFNLTIDHTKFITSGGMTIDIAGYIKTINGKISITNSTFDFTNPNAGSFDSAINVQVVGNSLFSKPGASNESYGMPKNVNGIAVNSLNANINFVLTNNKFYGSSLNNKSFISLGSAIFYSAESNSNDPMSTTLDAKITDNLFHNINVTIYQGVKVTSNTTSGPNFTANADITFTNNKINGQTGLYPFSYNTYSGGYKNAVLNTKLNIDSNTIGLDDSLWDLSTTAAHSAAIYIFLDQANNAKSTADINITKNNITVQNYPFIDSVISADFLSFQYVAVISPIHINISNNVMASKVVPDATHYNHVASVYFNVGSIKDSQYFNLTFKNNNITAPAEQLIPTNPSWIPRRIGGIVYQPVLAGLFLQGTTYLYTINKIKGDNGLGTLRMGGSANNTYHNP